MRIRLRYRKVTLIGALMLIILSGYCLIGIFHQLILDPDIKQVDILPVFHQQNHQQKICFPQNNIVFIKCMKCGTETLASILRRYGYERNLSFVLPINKRIYIGWPYQISKFDYRPVIKDFNMLVEHAIYNKTTLQKIMPFNTKYISIIREPFSRFVSSFYYFNIQKVTNITSTNPISEYLNNIDKYEIKYKSNNAKFRYCIPNDFSVTKNLLAQCLGFPMGFPKRQVDLSLDHKAVDKFIDQIDSDFELVLIMDYYDESLVLLKRLLCWKLQDIVYLRTNNGKYGGSKRIEFHRTPTNLHLHQNHDFIDYKIFHHFNQTLWKKINQQSIDFFEEVKTFQKINSNISIFCKRNISSTVIKKTKFSDVFVITRSDCDNLKEHILKKLTKLYDIQRNSTKIMPSGRIRALC